MSLNIAVFRMHASASLDSGIPRPIVTTTAPRITSASTVEETKTRIAKVFDKKEFSISTYDTAWVAMAPSPFSSEEPCFPDCLSWLLENQCNDGSWAQPHHHSLLKKDVLSSTLASILALNKWGLGQDQIKRGLYFLESNFCSATDDSQISPVGFEIIFPAMLEEAIGLPLNLRLEPRKLKDLMNKRDLELKRCSSDEVYLAYIGEGMGNKIQHWESVMKYQRRNGSLFNSPSTTAVAYTALRNSACLSYLNAALTKFGNAVPAVYPLDIYSQLCTVDNVQRLGISRYVSVEIQSVLDETYRCWVQGDEEIFMDALTCALAFRILRMNGYDVTSHQITKILEHSFSSSIVHGRMMDMNTALELYKASEFMLHPHETDLERQHLRLRRLLEQESSSGIVQSRQLGRNVKAEVKQALDFPFYAIVERMATRKAIEHYNFDNTRILKTSYFANYDDKDLFSVAVKDYNECQAIHVEELRELNRWFVDNRLDELTEFARHKCAYCYFTIASTLPAPELSDARMSWAKNTLMASVVDDLFDVEGSVEESNNLIELLELWDVDVSTECCSHNMKIIFSALKSTIRESGDKGSKLQGRDVTKHIISIWLDLLHSEMQEIKWLKNKITPTFDEYMSNAYVSAALGPVVLPTLYLVGPKLSEEMVNHAEYLNLFKTSSTCCRLLNDIRVDEREVEEGKVTALSLYIAEKGGGMTREAAIREIKTEIIDPKRRELLRLVLDSNSFIPKPCKELFWNACSNFSMFYSKGDGFWAQEFIQVVNQIIHQPISTTKSDTSVREDT